MSQFISVLSSRVMILCWTVILVSCALLFSNVVAADDLENYSFVSGRLVNDFFYENQDLSALQVDDWEDEESTVADKQAQVRTALLNALKDEKKRRKFAEVLPIVRVMSAQQRIALAALVSAQIGQQELPGRVQSLSLPQVRRMFGDDPDLILPITLDIANLIRDSTRPRGRATEHEPVPSAQALRRMLDIMAGDDSKDEDEDEHIGEVLVTSGDDHDVSNEVILANSTNINDNFRDFKPQFDDSLIKKQNNDTSPRSKKVANDQLAMPSEEHVAIVLPNVVANQTISAGNDTDQGNEELPQPEHLRWRHKRPGFKGNNFRHPMLSHMADLSADQKVASCFSDTLCLSTDDYPMDSIRASIRRNKNAMSALLVEFRDKEDEMQVIDNSELPDLDRRGEESSNSLPGTMCPSVVRYARPQKARSATGHWKYVVNTGEHTQTIRLEKCSRPSEPCTYLTDNFKSRCIQVYNYHRLLSWDANRGLHVDIFKIPTCCSCHVDDYRVAYPPIPAHPETTREIFPGKEFSNEADDFGSDDHVGEDTQLYERDVNQFHFNPGNPSKKYNKANLGMRGLDAKYKPNLMRDPEFDAMMEDTETTTQTYNAISLYPMTTSRRKPGTKNQGLPSFLEAPKPPRTRHPPSRKIIPFPSMSNTFKRGVNPFNTFDFSKRNNLRRPIRYSDQFPSDAMFESSEDKLNHFTMQGYDITTDLYDNSQISPPWQRMVTNGNKRTTIMQTNPATNRILYNRGQPKIVTTSKPKILHNADHKLPIKIRNMGRGSTESPIDYHDFSGEKDDSKEEDERKRINYNYHPIIDFFDGTGNRDAESRAADGIDLSEESEWKPMAVP